MQRKEARALAFEMLFEYGFHSEQPAEEFYHASLERRESGDDAYAQRLFLGAAARLHELDAIIAQYSRNWALTRMSKVSVALLRIAVYEMLFGGEIDVPIAINEAVELSKEYEGEDSFAFVNGVLGGVARSGHPALQGKLTEGGDPLAEPDERG